MSYVIIFRFGKVLIVQEVDSIDPLLLPVLRGDYIDQGKNKLSPRLNERGERGI